METTLMGTSSNKGLSERRVQRSSIDSFASLFDFRDFLKLAIKKHDGNLENQVNIDHITHIEKGMFDRVLIILMNPLVDKKESLKNIKNLNNYVEEMKKLIEKEKDVSVLNSKKYFLQWLSNKITAVSAAIQLEAVDLLERYKIDLNYRGGEVAKKIAKERLVA